MDQDDETTGYENDGSNAIVLRHSGSRGEVVQHRALTAIQKIVAAQLSAGGSPEAIVKLLIKERISTGLAKDEAEARKALPSERAIRKWMGRPDFRAEIDRCVRERQKNIARQSKAVLNSAVHRLQVIIATGTPNEAVKAVAELRAITGPIDPLAALEFPHQWELDRAMRQAGSGVQVNVGVQVNEGDPDAPKMSSLEEIMQQVARNELASIARNEGLEGLRRIGRGSFTSPGADDIIDAEVVEEDDDLEDDEDDDDDPVEPDDLPPSPSPPVALESPARVAQRRAPTTQLGRQPGQGPTPFPKDFGAPRGRVL